MIFIEIDNNKGRNVFETSDWKTSEKNNKHFLQIINGKSLKEYEISIGDIEKLASMLMGKAKVEMIYIIKDKATNKEQLKYKLKFERNT